MHTRPDAGVPSFAASLRLLAVSDLGHPPLVAIHRCFADQTEVIVMRARDAREAGLRDAAQRDDHAARAARCRSARADDAPLLLGHAMRIQDGRKRDSTASRACSGSSGRLRWRMVRSHPSGESRRNERSLTWIGLVDNITHISNQGNHGDSSCIDIDVPMRPWRLSGVVYGVAEPCARACRAG